MSASLIDEILSRHFIDDPAWDARLGGARVARYARHELLWPILDALNSESQHRWRLNRSLPSDTDPWLVAYLACLGEMRHAVEQAMRRGMDVIVEEMDGLAVDGQTRNAKGDQPKSGP